jgi:hypothetical protein
MKRLALLALLLCACDNNGTPLPPDGTLPAPDAGPTPDVTVKPDTYRGDGPGPMANVYKVDPATDNRKTSQVLLKGITDPEGTLTGRYTNVWNCINETGGTKLTFDLAGITVTGSLCKITKKAARGVDGSYLQIVPSSDDIDGGDAFSEIMMYHHVSTLGSHYENDYGLSRANKSLRALVNLQGYADMLGRWIGFPNAAYFPKEAANQLKQLLGVDLLNSDEGILFGYNSIIPSMPLTEYAQDATVIYHEYTHYMIGNRLFEPSPDPYGVDPTPFGLNEALADYMAASYLGVSKVGNYALGDMGRDLSRTFKCPDHIVGEEHNDGEIASGALWAARTLVGAAVLDPAIWKAVLNFTPSTTFEQASTAIVAQVKLVAPDKADAVKQIFVDHGMIGCVRLIDHKDFSVDALSGQAGPSVAGVGSVAMDFPDGVPGSMQYRVPIADTTKEITIEYSAAAGGLMGLPIGGGPIELWVALRRGSTPITYTYTSGKGAASNVQAMLKGESVAAGGQKLVLTGTCVSKGDLIFQFLNRTTSDGSISAIKVTQSPTTTQTTPNFDGCS